jgi:hypothetical protein
MTRSLESNVDLMVAEAVNAGRAGRLDVRRSKAGQDVLIEIELTGPEPHRLSLRVTEGGVLLDVDGSQAMEFAEVDDRDMQDLERVLRAYCLGELEVQVGLRDGKVRALRTSAGRLLFAQSALEALRPGHAKWRRAN